MKKTGSILLGLWMAAAVATADESGIVKVGVLSGSCSDPLVETLNKEPDLRADLILRPNARMFEDIDVLVVPQQRVAAMLTRKIPAIVGWVNGGGGILLFHDAVGYRQHIAMFPRIGRGMNHSRFSESKVVLEHPVTRGLSVGQTVKQGFQFDHISMEAADDSLVLVANEDGHPVVVAGKAGNGRVVLNGMITGGFGPPNQDWAEEKEGYPKGAERTLLVNAVRWLSESE